MDFINLPIFLFAFLLGGSVLASLLSFRIGIPLILAFLGIGVTVGESGLGLVSVLSHPKSVFALGSVALALILFDAGYQTPYRSYQKAAVPAILLATLGVALTALILAPIVGIMMGTGLLFALLLASVISSTDSASVFFMLRSQGIAIKERLKATLEIESGGNDPMAIFLTFMCLMLLQNVTADPLQTTGMIVKLFLSQFCIGVSSGVLLGYVLRHMTNKLNLELALYPIFVLAMALSGFALTNMLGGSGFLALYIAGFILGNGHVKAYTPILKFQQTLTWLSQILLFTSLGLFVKLQDMTQEIFPALAIGAALMFVVRPLMVFCILGAFKNYGFKEKVFVSFVGLRGATSVLLAIAPIVVGITGAQDLFNIVFIMVLISLTFQGFGLNWVAKKCGVGLPVLYTPPEAVQIDLPGLVDSALVMYKLNPTSGVLNGEKMPSWVRPVLIIRSGVSYTPTRIRRFKLDDLVYVFAPSDNRRRVLDHLFGEETIQGAVSILGDFPLSPQTTFQDIERLYGVHLPDALKLQTIAELIAKEFEDVGVGDRLSLGAIELVVRALKNGVPTQIGLDVDPARTHKTRKFLPFRHKKIV